MRKSSGALKAEPFVASERDVVALVAHELKQPLAAIQMALPLMADAPSPERREHARHVIERQLGYLRRLVGDLLDAERARRGDLRLDKTRIDLRSVVTETAATFTPRAGERGVTLTAAIPLAPVAVMGDAVRLQQVLSNLLENAIKHTEAGGSIRLELERMGGHARVTVRDTGNGIPPDLLPHIFERFRHGEGGGLGIGLNVARSLVELHGGRITAHSEGLGGGAEFAIVLPIARPGARRIARLRQPS